MADGRHVDTHLVGPSTLQRQLQQRGGRPRVAPSPLDHSVRRPGGSPTRGDRHLGGRPDRPSDWCVHLSAVVGHAPGHQCQVPALHAARRQLRHQRPVRGGGAGDCEQARRAPVQTVHDPGPVRSAHPCSDKFAEVREHGQQPTDQGALGVTGTRMHHQSGRFVDHRHVVVRVYHRETHAGICGRGGGDLLGQLHGEESSLPERRPPRGDWRTVDEHPAGLDQLGRHGTETSATIATPRSTRTPERVAGTSTEMRSVGSVAPPSLTRRPCPAGARPPHRFARTATR